MSHFSIALVGIGVVVGVVIAAILALVISQIHSSFVKKVEGLLQNFTTRAYDDIACHKQSVVDALTGNSKQLTQIIVDVKKDVEILKSRVGGAYSVSPAAPAGKVSDTTPKAAE